MMFQSPKSGKFESNMKKVYKDLSVYTAFQSPKSGKFESNEQLLVDGYSRDDVSIP